MGMMKGGNYNFSFLALANDRYLGIFFQIELTLSGGWQRVREHMDGL